MSNDNANRLEIAFDDLTMTMLSACAEWRRISVEELVKAYIEDWIDIDYPESRGRHTRRGIHRDGPITLDRQTRDETSQNWRDELGVPRL